jgi:hypothetical protein
MISRLTARSKIDIEAIVLNTLCSSCAPFIRTHNITNTMIDVTRPPECGPPSINLENPTGRNPTNNGINR